MGSLNFQKTEGVIVETTRLPQCVRLLKAISHFLGIEGRVIAM